MSLREIRERARRDLHTAMRVPASLYEPGAAEPRLIHVRVHTDYAEQGDLAGTNLNYAEREEVTPRLVFDRSEVPMPQRGSYVVLMADEGYRVGQAEPPDGITIKADVARMTAAELAGKTLPGDL